MSAIDTLPPLRDVLARHNLNARKSLGQNFLLDLNLTSRIARTAGDLSETHVVEVGPGPGGLTRAILANGAKSLTVIERDERCLPALQEISSHYPGRMRIVSDDALQVDYRALTADFDKTALLANLPYNVATPLLVGWLQSDPWPPWYQSMTLMFQREVAERIVAQPGDKHYGRLGVLAGWRTAATLMFDISPKAFTPPPKVTSSVVHFSPRVTPLSSDIAKLERVTAAAFQQRRKMLRAALKGVYTDPVATLEALDIDPTARAETITISDFVKLANAL
ncbi:MAG: 16S rRNA (adenine(1518)-N(6)/adenine(1519)-N(6))-dimethyltransferase RsmA [Pseudomonadota bacterium]